MKKIAILFVILFTYTHLFAQEEKEEVDAISYKEVTTLPLPESYTDLEEREDLKVFMHFLQNTFDYKFSFDSFEEEEATDEKKRVILSFDVNKKGNVENVKASSPLPIALAKETKRLINSLQLTPATLDGKPVKVFFDLYVFVNISTKSVQVSLCENIDSDDSCDFTIIEDAPIFPGCENKNSKSEKKRCFSTSVNRHVARKFNANLAQELGLSPGKKRINAQFTINKKGEVVDVKVRAPHIKLKKETERVINLLPKMIPGKQKGRPVGVKFNLPIVFVVIDDTPVKRKRRGLFRR